MNEYEFMGETITFRFRVSCSKGTYIRTLAVMIGEMLRLSRTYVILTKSSISLLFIRGLFDVRRD